MHVPPWSLPEWIIFFKKRVLFEKKHYPWSNLIDKKNTSPQVFYFVRKINIKLISQVSHPLFLATPKNTAHDAISSIDKSIELVNI
jgi:hypothetical protein